VNKYRFKNVINFNKVTINIADVVGGQWTTWRGWLEWSPQCSACVTTAYHDACRELAQPTNFLTSSLTIFL